MNSLSAINFTAHDQRVLILILVCFVIMTIVTVLMLVQAQNRIDELKKVCYDSYIVMGVLANEAGRFGQPDIDRVLDNLSETRLVHKDVIPFSTKRGTVIDIVEIRGYIPPEREPRPVTIPEKSL